MFNSSSPGQNGCHLTDDIFKCISLNEKFLNPIWMKFVSKGAIDNMWALVQVMAWRRIGDKPLPEPMLIQFTNAYAALGGEELISAKPGQNLSLVR